MTEKTSPKTSTIFSRHSGLIVAILLLSILPFIIGFFEGASPAQVLVNEGGTSKFVQGLMIEIFILALYALSFDLIFGITGMLSFGHSMFFATGAYLSGALLKSFEMSLGMTMLWVIVAAVLNALLFGIVLPRVQGITFALVTLGLGSVFHILIMSRELGEFTGADVGLQGIPTPDFLSPAAHRLRFYFIAMIIMFLVYLLYKRFVTSPTGRVCIAIRENEGRAKMLGYNTFYFKLTALIISSLTAALAGTIHALYQPIVSPNTAAMSYTVVALLIMLIGGVGTLDGALIGAAVYRLLDFGLRRYLGESASFINGAVYVLIVLFIPYGIVGTWRMRSFNLKEGWQQLLARFSTKSEN